MPGKRETDPGARSGRDRTGRRGRGAAASRRDRRDTRERPAAGRAGPAGTDLGPAKPGGGRRGPVAVRQIHRPNLREALAIVSIYHDCFPPEQRISDSSLLGTIDELPDSTDNVFYVAERRSQIVGFAYMLFFPAFRMAHLMYLGVAPEEWGGGAGGRLLDTVIRRCQELGNPPHWLTVEAARPEFAPTAEEREASERTIRFLEHVGCQRVPADFQAPPVGPDLPLVPYWIMARPIADDDVDPALIPDMVAVLYQRVYGLQADHPLVLHCLKSLPGAADR